MRKYTTLLPIAVATLGILLPVLIFLNRAGAASDLITYWKFDETTTGATAVDSSSSAFNGTPHGILSNGTNNAYRPQPSTDVPPTSFNNPRSLHFLGDSTNSTGSYVDVSNWSVNTSNGFTVSLWAKPTTSGGSWERFFDFGNGPASDNIVFAQNASSNRVFFEVYNGGSTTKITAPAGSWMVGSWHYYTATIDANGNATIYIDGQAVVSGTTNKPLNIPRTNKYIGKSNWGDSYYEGYMDDIRIYGRALTNAEVLGLATGGPGPGVSPTGQPINPNGLTDAMEDASPNSGDANNDGTPDSQQANIASFTNTQTGAYTTVAAPSACTLTSLSNASMASHAVADPAYTYPAGFTNYTASCGTPGYTATVKLYLYGIADGNFLLRKYNPTTTAYTTIPNAAISRATIGGQAATVVQYQLTDGGPFDTDGVVNGVIVDPVGMGAVPASISPTSANLQAPDTGAGVPPIDKTTAAIASAVIPAATAVFIYALRSYRRLRLR